MVIILKGSSYSTESLGIIHKSHLDDRVACEQRKDN